MPAVRYHLRFQPSSSFFGNTYGSDTYGSGVYGMLASDPVPSLTYNLMPWPVGSDDPSPWVYRRYDALPTFGCQIRSIDAGPLDLAAVGTAQLVLSPFGAIAEHVYPLTVTDAARGRLSRDWVPGDLDDIEIGPHRVLVVLTFTSGRRLTLAADDRDQLYLREAIAAVTP